MAITQVAEYARLSASDIEELASELDAIRRDVEASRGEQDRRYILRTIAFQRYLEVGARILIGAARSRTGCAVGAVALAVAKCIENMELAHNIGHGQWDWMNDPGIHSTTWEWDMVGPSAQWRYSHNYRHHVFTNVIGMDDDLGYGVLRVTPDQKWRPVNLVQPVRNIVMAVLFEWGIGLHDLAAQRDRAAADTEKSTHKEMSTHKAAFVRKICRQVGKDYVLFPALSLRRWRRTLGANAAANLLRNLWAYVVICCGHFADGAEKFAPAALQDETKPEWYLRQMLGSANFRAGPVMAFLSGNLCYQIEHHLFPDLPSNRYAAIAKQVRALCATYDLPYTTGPLARQYLQTFRTVLKLALPDRLPVATCDDAPEPLSAYA